MTRKTPQKTLEANARWRKANSDKMRMYSERWARAHPEARMHTSAKHRAKRLGVPFDISREDIKVPSHCPVLGIELVSGTGVSGKPGGNPNSPSLDRIIPELGYVRGNIMVMSHLANTLKGSATPEHLLNFAKWILDTYEN